MHRRFNLRTICFLLVFCIILMAIVSILGADGECGLSCRFSGFFYWFFTGKSINNNKHCDGLCGFEHFCINGTCAVILLPSEEGDAWKKIVDKKLSTSWSPKGDELWVEFNYEKPVKLQKIEFASSAIKDFKFLWWDPSTMSWQDVDYMEKSTGRDWWNMGRWNAVQSSRFRIEFEARNIFELYEILSLS